MKQFYITFLLSLLMSMVVNRSFAYDYTDGTFFYNYSHDPRYGGVFVVSDMDADYSGDVIIPDHIDNLPIVGIGPFAFAGFPITSIIIPNTVKFISSSAFDGCSELTSITIPSSVIDIGSNVFESTPWYDNLPDGLVYAGQVAYKYKGTMPNNTAIELEDGTTGIAKSAFYGCSGLTSITIPQSVEFISSSAFENCSNLTSIIVEWPEPPTFYDYEGEIFSNCSNATLYVPVGSKEAYETAWDGLFKEILAIGELGAVVFADANVKALCVANWDSNRDGGVTVEELAAVTDLGYVFSYNKTITSFDELEYFTGLTSIGDFAFNDCSGVTSITIPSNVTSVGDGAFAGCTSLSSITIPNSVRSIGCSAFESCPALASINIPEGVTTIGDYAFGGCSNLTSITIPVGVTSINDYVFYDCSGLTSIFIPEGVTTIGIHAFIACSSLTSIDIPSSVTSIGEEAFMECTSLTSIEIPSNVTNIGDRVFSGCTSLTNVTNHSNVITIGDGTFEFCNNLTSIEIPSSVTSIGEGAFVGCDNLTSVTIPRGVTSIGDYAFDCSNLTSVMVEWLEPITITSDAFPNQANATLYVPAGSKAAYETDDYWNQFKEIVEVGEPEPQTDNVLSASSTTILSGNTEKLSISLTNEDEIIMTEFFMQLPEGITIEEDDDGYPIVTINSERENKHVIEVSRNSEGLYHFLCYSSNNNAFKGNEGELFNMNLICAEGVTAGTYTATVKDIIMSDVDRNELTQSDFTFNISVMDVAMGDANGDGRINGMDIVEMVDYIMERPSNSFVFAAADLTSDGKVNGMDLVELVSLVMAQGAQAPPSALPRREGTLQTEKLDEGTLTLKENENGELMLGVENPDEFILAQMIVEVSDGTLTDVTTDAKHDAVWSQIGAGRYAVLAYSTRNRSFTTNNCLLTFLGCEGNVTVKDMMLIDVDREAKFFADVTYNGTTGIDSPTNASLKGSESIYDLSGRKLETRNMELGTSPKGVYIVNGKKVVVK